jgi:hypothetical protein
MKQIYVQAQPDHIESLSKSAPIAAIEELVWNALDADAREVKVDLLTNPLGAVESVRVSDDGTGIDATKADATFGSLGGSWKRSATQTESAGRRLHGRHGLFRRSFIVKDGMNQFHQFRDAAVKRCIQGIQPVHRGQVVLHALAGICFRQPERNQHQLMRQGLVDFPQHLFGMVGCVRIHQHHDA